VSSSKRSGCLPELQAVSNKLESNTVDINNVDSSDVDCIDVESNLGDAADFIAIPEYRSNMKSV
jgi:hypothetical protein